MHQNDASCACFPLPVPLNYEQTAGTWRHLRRANAKRGRIYPTRPIDPQPHAPEPPAIPSPQLRRTHPRTRDHGSSEWSDTATPRRGRGRGRLLGGRAAVVRAHRVPGVRGGGQRQRVRDPAVQRRHVGFHCPHRGHLLRRRHPHRLPAAVQLHPGEERVQRDDRDDGAGADAGGAERRAVLRLLLRGQLLRAGEEPAGPAAGGGAARAEVGRGQVRRRAPLRRLRGRLRRRRAGRAARRQPAGDQVGRRRLRRAQGRPDVVLHRGAVQLAVRVQRQGQRDMDALRRQGRIRHVTR